MVAGGLGPPAALADAPRSCAVAGDADPAMLDAVAAGARRAARREVATPRCRCAPRSPSARSPRSRRCSSPWPTRRADDLAAAAKIVGELTFVRGRRPDASSVTAEIVADGSGRRSGR